MHRSTLDKESDYSLTKYFLNFGKTVGSVFKFYSLISFDSSIEDYSKSVTIMGRKRVPFPSRQHPTRNVFYLSPFPSSPWPYPMHQDEL